ncbi:MAG: nucleoside-diphosphate kinase [Lentisphaeria bacterium]|nr:nucleoside-diphosphate kinase [Lentisphaeria bacterium]
MSEKSLVIIKPDGVQRHLMGRIIQRYEDAGLQVLAMRFGVAEAAQVEAHYQEHKGKPFFQGLIDYITQGPSLFFVLGGMNAIDKIRAMNGATEPSSAAPGTIRGDFAHMGYGDKPLYNLVHASATPEEAAHEISVWFSDDEVVDFSHTDADFHGA